WLTAGLFHQVVEEHLDWLRPLKQLLSGGDVLSPTHVRKVLEAFPGIRMINGYGPTENTTFTTCYTVPDPAAAATSVSIGRPVANTRIYVVDRDFEASPQGVPGELLTGGEGLARGYLGRPALTAEKLVPNPFAGPGLEGDRLYRTGDLVRWNADGTLDFLGRIDHQLKVRGFRVEPGEIEAALSRHPAVADCLVVGRQEASGDKRLVAYFVPDEAHAAGSEAQGGELVSELRAFLEGRLPAYLVPDALVELPEFPLNPNGKVDRKALPAPEEMAAAGEEELAAPRTPTEEILCGLYAALLGRSRVGATENFFELGGHSLLATRLASRIEQAFGVRLPLSALFEAPSVREVAREVDQMAGLHALPPIEAQPEAAGEIPLSYAQRRLWFLLQLDPQGPRYNVPAALRLRGRLDGEALGRTLEEIWQRHQVLRTTFHLLGESPVQRVGQGPFPGLAEVDLSERGEAADEALRTLTEAEVEHRFDLTVGPLFRASLIRLGEDDHLLLVNFHHLVSDGWSLGVFQEELVRLYGAFSR
ncbi:MAG: AMP-binding protein, partial [Acidobacteria bacterium]|nr:AMP-binding protein [Acidobacteriota bacterium]